MVFHLFFFILKISICYTSENRYFSKENCQKIKEIQRGNKGKQNESATQSPVKAVCKLNKYNHIQSTVSQRIQVGQIFF